MTVKELKQQLKDLPDDALVVLQKDSEGNGFSPLSGVGLPELYCPNNDWSGEVNRLEFDIKYYENIEDYESFKSEAVQCIVLWPSN